MNISASLRILFFVVLCESSIPEAYDERCSITVDSAIPLSKCSRQRWFFNRHIKVCTPSCNETSPFSSKIECQATCRSGDVCHFPVASSMCDLQAVPVYIYSPKDASCFLTYDCTYLLNKFPTLQECYRTCKRLPQDNGSTKVHNAAQGPRLPSYYEILTLHRTPASSWTPTLQITIPPKPPNKHNKCRMNVVPTTLNNCLFKRWYFDEYRRACLPTCSRHAPFINKLACDGMCRTGEVCNFPMASFPCLQEVHPVFIYNPNDQSCFKSLSCSYFGNKFPTLDECRQTCKKCAKESLGCSTANNFERNDHTRRVGSSHATPTPALHPSLPNNAGLMQHN
uniref:Putative trilaris n=1 Tax=Rhipicephalus pulchellus TaxID=72859 RepID=L7LSF9_RHIPC